MPEFIAKNWFYLIEILVTIEVIRHQLRFYMRTKRKTKVVAAIFPDKPLGSDAIYKKEYNGGEVEMIKDFESAYSPTFKELLAGINRYLNKNKGTVDFAIIRNLVERSIQAKENEVASTVSLPLYVGLMGTFIGVILGLIKIAFFGGVTDTNINAFLGGIVIAMIASFLGLLLTVINNSGNFKEAKTICDDRKNQFYNFLQVELLPHLGNSLHDALDRLKDNINQFNVKFGNNVKLFDENFSSNIVHLKTSVESLADNITPIIENTKTQKEFLEAIRKIGYDRMAQANLKVFSVMKEAGPLFVEFIEKQKQLNQSIERTGAFISTIQEIMNRVRTFEESINNLGERIDTADYLQSDLLKKVNSKLSHLDNQFDLLKQHSQRSTELVHSFFETEYNKIAGLTGHIRREIERALDFNVDQNPFQKLLLLDKLCELEKLGQLDKLHHLDKLDILMEKLEILNSLDHLGKLSDLEKLNHLDKLNQLEKLSERSTNSSDQIAWDVNTSKEYLEKIKEQLSSIEEGLKGYAPGVVVEEHETGFLHKLFNKNGKHRGKE